MGILVLVFVALAVVVGAVIWGALKGGDAAITTQRSTAANAVAGAWPAVSVKDDCDPFEVVGESNYQAALEDLCGGRSDEGADEEVLAVLELEDDNAYDDQAVVVTVEGRTVGYLSRAAARTFRKELKRLDVVQRRFVCEASIVGGWDRGGGDRGHFGIELDLGPPMLCRPPQPAEI